MTRRPFALAKLLLVAALVLAVAGPALAFRQPDPTPLSEKEHRSPELYIGNLYKHPSDLPSVAAGRAAADLQSLGVAADHSRIDRRTGRWGTLMMGEPLLPGYGNDLTWNGLGVAAPSSHAARQAEAWNAFYGWVRDNQLALRINPEELRRPGHVTVHDDGGFIQIIAPRQIGGVPVRDSYLTAVISGGNLILFGAVNWGDVGTSPIAAVDAGAARDRLLGHIAPHSPVGRLVPSLELIPLSRGGDDPALISVGQGLDYRLAWVLRPRFPNSVAEYEGLIDAHTGELIAFEDKANYGETTRSVIGGVYTVSNDQQFPDGIELVYPMPFADLATVDGDFFTDAGGNLASGGVPICVDGTITTELKGRYVTMTDTCGAILQSTAGDVLNLGTSGGIDCTVPPGASPGNTHATRSGFYELNQMHAMGRGHIPTNAAVNGTLPATMNIQQTCNASGGAGGVNFFRSGGGCSNTGEIAGVFDHEWGHHMDALDANPGISSPGEGIADIYASLRLNTSCIGRNFRPGVACPGYGDPCINPPGPLAACTGVRDIDWAHRASGQPHDIAWINTFCPGGTGPCGGSVHCEGAVYAEAVWDLWNRDLPSLYGMSIDQAREIAARLTFRGGQLVGNWFQCIQGGTGGGCNADGGYLNYLAADDDDANLANGTPHMEAIFDAFNRHGIACTTPTVQDSGCAGAPVAAPNLTVVGLDRATHLSWNAVAGASSYRIFRTQSDPLIFLDGFETGDTQQWIDGDFSCDFGKILVGETTDLSFIDTQGLLNGQEYHYMVFAMGTGDSCYGPASACRTSRPEAGPNLAVPPVVTNLDIQTGDADPFVDNCEVVEVSFDVGNVGTGTQTNVRAVSVTSPSHPGIDGSITFPAQYAASLGPCASATGTFTFTASGLSSNDVVEFLVEVTSDELDAQLSGQVKTQTYAISATESDLQAQASLLFDFESDLDGWTVTDPPFTRMSGGGGNGTTWRLESSSLQNNQCDRIRSPLMQFQATSTLSLWNNYDIEPFSAGTWYDRANVALVNGAGTKVVVEPDGGRPYNAAPGGPGSYSGCNDGETGWADTNNTWGTSTWSAAEFGAVAPPGLSQIEVTYSTDAALAQVGFWFDEVQVTNVSVQVPDAQSDVCGP